MLVTTVAARNYLPQARVLARSFLDHHPGGRVVVLVLDAPGDGLRDDEPFEVVTPGELPMARRELQRMATIYDVMELATALKPTLLRHLLVDRGADTVTYLDPDIEVFAPLGDVTALARTHGIVLTPHRTRPVPDDERGPREQVFIQAGAYNLGFVAVSAAAVPFLDWWAARCRRDCVRSFPDGLFVDQRWVDLAVTYFDHHVLDDPGCNVAYWNLDTRPIATRGGRFTAGGAPLRFFHFSAFQPDRRHLLSRHQGERPRVLLSESPALRELCNRYADRLEAEGWLECSKLTYGLDEAANGMRIDLTMRRVYRDEVLRRERGVGDRLGRVDDLPDPFDPEQVDQFLELLRSPFPGSEAPRVPRYLHALYRQRPDLQRSFPDLTGLAGNHFLWWVREMGHRDLGIPPELVPSAEEIRRGGIPAGGTSRSAPGAGRGPQRGPGRRQRGVRVVGYLDAELGVGEAGRAMVAGLQAIGERVSLVHDRGTSSRQRHRRDEAAASAEAPGAGAPPAGGEASLGSSPGDIDLVCVNADRLPAVMDRLAGAGERGRHTIGVWGWEVEDFPAAYAPAADLVDEVWTYSAHAARAIGRTIDKPVRTVPLPVVERRPARRTRTELGLPEGFVFLFCFDFFSVAERKNPLGVLEAFCRAFRPGEGPQLVLKSINGSVMLAELERLRVRAVDRPDVHVVDGYLDVADQRALIASCDAYVSLHRAEGFGYTMAEAMLAGRPVIATGYSGNLEFMDEANSFLVGYEMTAIGEDCHPYPAGGLWADPDLDEAAGAMRRVVEDPGGARAVAERGRHDIRRFHSPAARGPLLAARLAASRAAAQAGRPARVTAPMAAKAAAAARRGRRVAAAAAARVADHLRAGRA